MTSPDITPRKPPRQRRAKVTVEIILEAATRVLAAGGLTEFTTNRVADVAGVSIGSLYQYFPNKAALIAALIAQAQIDFAAEVERLVMAADDIPLDGALRDFAAFAVRQQYGRPLLAAALDSEEARLPVAPILQAAEARIRAAVARLAARHRHPDPATAARHLFVITKALVEADIGDSAGPPPDLADRLHRTLAGYLAKA
jgi:AcrR family transcriptional regulator